TARWNERPMRLPLRAFRNPTVQQLNLCSSQFLAGFDRRHDLVLVLRTYALDQFAGFRFAGNNGDLAVRQGLEGIFLAIQPQFRLALAFVRPMTGVTVLGEDGPDVAVELRSRCLGRFRDRSPTSPNGKEQPTRGQRRANCQTRLRPNWRGRITTPTFPG